MAKKKSFVLRLDPEVYKAIEKWAADEFRSVNGQLEWMIDKELNRQKRHPSKSANKTQGNDSSDKG